MMIDRSASMAGVKMQRVREELKRFVKPILASGKRKVITLMFDHNVKKIEGTDYT